MTTDDIEELLTLARELRCTVTAKRCGEFGCANEGATVMPPEWRCPTCAVFWKLTQLAESSQPKGDA